ncbi:hypothetical protein BHE74_00035040, partial [Ensete ventricosum]
DLHQERADFLNLELLEGVELVALPHLVLDRKGVAASRPKLLVSCVTWRKGLPFAADQMVMVTICDESDRSL